MLSVEDYIPLMKKELQVIGQTSIDWIYEAKLRGAFDSEFQLESTLLTLLTGAGMILSPMILNRSLTGKERTLVSKNPWRIYKKVCPMWKSKRASWLKRKRR